MVLSMQTVGFANLMNKNKKQEERKMLMSIECKTAILIAEMRLRGCMSHGYSYDTEAYLYGDPIQGSATKEEWKAIKATEKRIFEFEENGLLK